MKISATSWFVLLLLACVGLAIGLRISGAWTPQFTDEKIMSYLGTVVTVFSFAVGCYFALLAVTALGHIRDIEKISAEAKEFRVVIAAELERVRAATEDANRMNELFFLNLLSGTSVLSGMVQKGEASMENKGLVEEMHKIRERCLFSLAKDETTRLNHARNLVQLGGRDDYVIIRPFLVNSTSPDSKILLSEIDRRSRA